MFIAMAPTIIAIMTTMIIAAIAAIGAETSPARISAINAISNVITAHAQLIAESGVSNANNGNGRVRFDSSRAQ